MINIFEIPQCQHKGIIDGFERKNFMLPNIGQCFLCSIFMLQLNLGQCFSVISFCCSITVAAVLDRHQGHVTCLDFSPCDTKLMSGSTDKVLLLLLVFWSLKSVYRYAMLQAPLLFCNIREFDTRFVRIFL